MCTLAAVSRASYYRSCGPPPPDDEKESRLRDALQRIALAHRHYGYRRVTQALRAQHWEVNPKRVARLMRVDNLLAIGKRRFAPVTTDSQHELEVAINVARRLRPTAVNQLWVADITDLRLGRVDVFLAVVMDAFSRKIIGWHLAPTLATVQYASGLYVDTLREHGMIPSMSRPGNPYDNAKCERFMKTLKQEEIRCGEYRDIEDLRMNLTSFFDTYYNATRLHSALGYQSPNAFEQSATATSSLPDAPKLSFSRQEEIYQSDVRS